MGLKLVHDSATKADATSRERPPVEYVEYYKNPGDRAEVLFCYHAFADALRENQIMGYILQREAKGLRLYLQTQDDLKKVREALSAHFPPKAGPSQDAPHMNDFI